MESGDAITLAARDPQQEAFVQLLLIYMSIAVTSRDNAEAIFKDNQEFFTELRNMIAQNNSDLRGRFVAPDAPLDVFRIDSHGVHIVAMVGCIEAFKDQIWVMYKTYWSPSAEQSRCERDR
jgi:hypothetical protein